MIKLTQLLDGISILHMFKFSLNAEEKAAKNFKRIHATFTFDGMSIEDGLDKAVRQAAISWQHANRDDWASFTDGQKLVIVVKAAGRKQVDHEAATATKYAGSDAGERKAILRTVVGDTMSDEQLEALLEAGTPVDITNRKATE